MFPQLLASYAPCLPAIQDFSCTMSANYSKPHNKRQPESFHVLSLSASCPKEHNRHQPQPHPALPQRASLETLAVLALSLNSPSSHHLVNSWLICWNPPWNSMELVRGREWSFEALAVPQMGHVPSTEIENPITMENFLSSACRRCDGIRTTTLMFDFHPQVPQFGGFRSLG